MASIIKQAFDKATLLACKGYSPTFIDNETVIGYDKVLSVHAKKSLPLVEGNDNGALHYTDLTVFYDKERQVPFFSAYNIDGSNRVLKVSRASNFRIDPRIPADIQLSKKGFYDLRTDITEFEIGHMAANNEMAWGTDAQLKAYQTFHFPNSAPQAEKLNTGIWKTLETYIINEATAIESDKRICVFTGPLLSNSDPAYIKLPSFKIPLLFFKVIVFMSPKGLYSTAFMMSHEQKMIDDKMFVVPPTAAQALKETPVVPFDDFKYRKVFQVNIAYLESLTGLHFRWKGVKSIKVPNDKNQVDKIRKIRDAKDAEDAAKKGGRIESLLTAEPPTKAEIKTGKFKLNLILP